MAAKVFEVGDVLPAGQIKIIWDFTGKPVQDDDGEQGISSDGIFNIIIFGFDNTQLYIMGEHFNADTPGETIITLSSPCTITSLWDTYDLGYYDIYVEGALFWEVVPSGYSITFEENGGTSVTDLSEQTALPDPLPTTTKSGYTFVAWYYESNFQTRAKAGDTIESNVTLYAKWHNLGSLFTEIADAIRSKDGTSENIRDVDFGERIKQIQGAKEEETKTVTPDFSSGNQVITPTSGKVLSQVTLTKPTDLIPENIAKDKNVCGVVGTSFIAVELTQTQYDALSTKDSNTYYLIVEE